MNPIIALTIGSIAWGFARYFLGGWITRMTGSGFPYGTLIVNIAGCFLIGFFAVVAENKIALSPSLRMLLMTGFCGAFTTFSTFMLETGTLTDTGHAAAALAYILISVIAGFALYRLGIFLGGLV